MKYPFALTEANLKTAMTDPRYTNSRHPEASSWRDMVSQGFATLYPDESLRGDHTDALPRFQGADGHIYASDGTLVARGKPAHNPVLPVEWNDQQGFGDTAPERSGLGGGNRAQAYSQAAANEGGGADGGGGGGGHYNPDQPRDWHGRWTSEGGGEGGGSDTPPPESGPKKTPAPNTPPPPTERGSQGQSPLPPPTGEPVNPDQMQAQLGYDPVGPRDQDNLLQHPIDGARAWLMANEATKAASDAYGKDNPELADGEGDGFRHALWSYMMTKDLGADTAKAIGDGHERSGADSDGARLMDL